MICVGSGRWQLVLFFRAEGGIRDIGVTGVQTCALPICDHRGARLDCRQVHDHGRGTVTTCGSAYRAHPPARRVPTTLASATVWAVAEQLPAVDAAEVGRVGVEHLGGQQPWVGPSSWVTSAPRPPARPRTTCAPGLPGGGPGSPVLRSGPAPAGS